MSEADAVRLPEEPATVETLAKDLRALGVEEGMILLVHSSLSALGWVCGGAVAVIQALGRALGPTGTLVLPAFTSAQSDPSYWTSPPVPESWWERIRATMPAFDPAVTPTEHIGVIPECFRSQPGVRRTRHPHGSFAARGARAAEVLTDEPLSQLFGDASPLGRLYDLEGHVLLLGCGHGSNTSLHLAETRARYPNKRVVEQGAPLHDGWTTYEVLDMSTDDFEQVGDAFAPRARTGKVACADASLFRQRDLVDFAVAWMEENRR